MVFKNIKIQQVISFLIIISIFAPSLTLFSAPKKVLAQAVTTDVSNIPLQIPQVGTNATTAAASTATTGTSATTATTAVKTWYQTILEEVLKAVAKRALQEITKSTVNWINSGFHGSPLFLENPGSFFTDIVKSEVKTIVNTYGYDNLKFPYGKDFALNTIKNYKRTAEDNATYTLSKVINDPVYLESYQKDFKVGGWGGFITNTQYPQNNYLGFQRIVNQQLAEKISSSPGANNAISKTKESIQQAQGFLSPETCPTNEEYNKVAANAWNRPSFSPSTEYKPEPQGSMTDAQYKMYLEETNTAWKEQVANEKTSWEENNTCPGGLKTTTPGAVVSSQVMNALGSNMRQGELSAALGNSLSAIFDALINALFDAGLSALTSDKNNEAPEDDWTYMGQTLGGPQDANGDPFSAFDEVVILKAFKILLEGRTFDSVGISFDGTITTTEGLTEPQIGDTRLGTCTNINDRRIFRNNVLKKNCDEKIEDWQQNAKPYVRYVPGEIENTKEEIALMDNTSPDPFFAGIIQLMKLVPVEAQKLDMCIPGPDKGWEYRLKAEQERVSKALVEAQGGGEEQDALKMKASAGALRELKFAVDSFKDWITTAMISPRLGLPNSIIYIDEIQKINDISQKLEEAINSRRAKSQTLIRLQTIKTGLDEIEASIAPLNQPAPDSVEEKKMIALWKQYRALRTSISSTHTIEERKNERASLSETLTRLKTLNAECILARGLKGWDAVDTPVFDINGDGIIDGDGIVDKTADGKGNSVLSSLISPPNTIDIFRIVSNREGDSTASIIGGLTGGIVGSLLGGFFGTEDIVDRIAKIRYTVKGTEIEQFCGLPIINGYSHGEVIRQDSSNELIATFQPGYIPQGCIDTREPNEDGTPLEPFSPDPGDGSGTQGCSQYAGSSGGGFVGTGREQFTFRNQAASVNPPDGPGPAAAAGTNGYTSLPMVNAQYIYGDITTTGIASWGIGLGSSEDNRISIDIDCDTVFKANKTDYTHAGDLSF